MTTFARVFLVGWIVLAGTGCAGHVVYASDAYRGKVVDAETGQPLVGAVVLAIWYREVPTAPHGPAVDYHDALEVLTDAQGKFVIPAKMHLVEDASVPEHVRNDPHPYEYFCRAIGKTCYGSYEWWLTDEAARTEDGFVQRFLSNPRRPDPAILRQPTGDSAAPVPIARLIDTDTYRGTDPNVTLGSAIGIAEVAHANFFSEDTGGGVLAAPRPIFPFPDPQALLQVASGGPS